MAAPTGSNRPCPEEHGDVNNAIQGSPLQTAAVPPPSRTHNVAPRAARGILATHAGNPGQTSGARIVTETTTTGAAPETAEPARGKGGVLPPSVSPKKAPPLRPPSVPTHRPPPLTVVPLREL